MNTKRVFQLVFLALMGVFLTGLASRHAARTMRFPVPNDPASYLAFSEYLDDNSVSADEQLAALQSAILGAAFASESGDDSTAASCLIAAASFTSFGARAEFWDLAVMIDPSRVREWRTHRDARSTTAEIGASVLMYARYGYEGPETDPQTDLRIQRMIDDASARAGITGARIREILAACDADTESDPCNGRLFVPQRDRDSKQVIRVLCPHHERPAGALGNDEQFLGMLRTEMILLGITSTGWASGNLEGANSPLRDPSIEQLMQRFGVSTARPYWKNGQWSASP